VGFNPRFSDYPAASRSDCSIPGGVSGRYATPGNSADSQWGETHGYY